MNTGWGAHSGWRALATAVILAGCGENTSEPDTPSPIGIVTTAPQGFRVVQAPQAIRDRLQTEAIVPRVIQETVAAPGEVALDLKRVAKVTSRIEGQVEHVYVQLGDRVRSGQPLLAIGSLRLDELVQEYLVSKAQADVAESNLRRTKELWREQIVPERRLVEEQGRFNETKARFQHVREKLLNMGMTTSELRELERGSHLEAHLYTLKAPLSGTVVTQNVVLGQGVSPGNDLLEIVDTSHVWVFANLPIEQARRFKEGDLGVIVPKVGEPVTAPLAYLAPVADEQTRTVRVRFDIPNEKVGLRPNEFVEVRLPFKGPASLAVPVSALTMIDRVRGVFVERESGYAFVPIETGREGGGWIEVELGLTGGERVVTAGVFDLKNVLLKEAIQSGEEG